MDKTKKKVKEGLKIINQNLNSNKAKRECGGCYYYSVLTGLSCRWVDELDCVCPRATKKDIEYTIENC